MGILCNDIDKPETYTESQWMIGCHPGGFIGAHGIRDSVGEEVFAPTRAITNELIQQGELWLKVPTSIRMIREIRRL